MRLTKTDLHAGLAIFFGVSTIAASLRAMTAFAAILALSPLALGIGHGSAMQQPLAIAIIAGLIFSLPLVLIVLPCTARHFRDKSGP
jgi:multidrug efflux pump subunit AcrB